ncbi:hypothetical protein [Xanthovirga aplysinae]|uniref:hypothetical protein n=1 Tax=Xanthovirga aplysinae TaxID=2529853 RepID=UPI0012BC6C23|nr:hypothetical protein [Xanthovirga aplysinae]MTI33202.1 hypothetical protein [Xanthovirga aplysinae]
MESYFNLKKIFKNLRENEVEYMLDVPVLISLLIAGVEKTYNKTELEQAKYFAQVRETHDREELEEYYHAVAENFDKRLDFYMDKLDENKEKREASLYKELSRLNHILPVLDPKFQVELYASLKTYARHIAEASGGILGYFAITPEELKLIDLPMIEKPQLDED